MGYDPNSSDSMFSRLMERMDTTDTTLGRIEDRLENFIEKSEKRINSLENWRTDTKAKVALISFGVSALVAFVGWYLGH